MNKLYLTLSVMLMMTVVSFSQCDIDYDFGEVGFGISPDAALGETFINGEVNQEYYDVIHVLVPTYASDVDEEYPPTLPIDSLTLASVTVQDTITWEEFPIQDLGLDIICNNNGDSEDPCMFYGGQQYCASIQGTPTMSGVFQININVIGYLTIFEPFEVPLTFSNYVVNFWCNIIEEPVITNANSETGTLGSVDITELEGVNVLSYEWTNEDGVVVGTTGDIDGLEPGIYTLVIATPECTSTFENIIIEDEAIDCTLDASYVVTDEIPGVSMGSVDLTLTGANGDASFVWTNEVGVTVSTDEDLINATAGEYEVVITDEEGCIEVVTQIHIGVNSVESLELTGISVTPNPANDILQITLDSDLQSNVEILDSRGRVVYSETIVTNTSLDVSAWEQAVYFLTVSNELGRSTSRLVIQH